METTTISNVVELLELVNKLLSTTHDTAEQIPPFDIMCLLLSRGVMAESDCKAYVDAVLDPDNTSFTAQRDCPTAWAMIANHVLAFFPKGSFDDLEAASADQRPAVLTDFLTLYRVLRDVAQMPTLFDVAEYRREALAKLAPPQPAAVAPQPKKGNPRPAAKKPGSKISVTTTGALRRRDVNKPTTTTVCRIGPIKRAVPSKPPAPPARCLHDKYVPRRGCLKGQADMMNREYERKAKKLKEIHNILDSNLKSEAEWERRLGMAMQKP
eukprot:PhM_4_TR17720/c0_g1_i1/m.48026